MASLPSKITTPDKEQTEPYDSSKLNAEDYNELKSKFNALIEFLSSGPSATDLSAPVNLQVAAISSTVIGVSWNEVANATGYMLQSAANAAFTIDVKDVYSGPLLSAQNSGLSAGATRYYRVKALGTGSYTDSPYSAAKGTTTQAAPVTPVTTYTGTYTTSAGDYSAKCGAGTYGNSVQKTATSTVSQADADAKAKAEAIAAITCPVVTQPPATTTYTATQQSYTARCGTDKPGTGSDVTRTNSTETSTVSQADANAKALAAATQAAIAALVCTVPPTQYEWTLTGPSEADSTGVTLTTDGSAYQLNYERIFNGDSTPKRMDVFVGGNQLGLVDFPASYLGKPFNFKVGTRTYTATFTDGSITLS